MIGELRLGDIAFDKESQDWRLFLCKPDKTVIAPIKDITQPNYNIYAGKVNDISFSIPAIVEVDHQPVENPLIEKIKHRYLFKMIYNNVTEYFVFNEQDKQYGNEETISYKAYSLGYMLRDKTIRDYSAVSKNIMYILDEILMETNWKIGFIDADINSKYRSHEIANNNVLEAVYEIAEKFNGLIVWDTINEKINIYKPQNVGKNKGFRLREGKYLESFSMNSNSDEVVTRLKVYGKEGLTFRRLSPTGSNYIEDFSWFLYPFEMDDEGNVIRSSDYMSDGLAKGIVEYQNHLASIQGQFETLTTNLTEKRDEIQQREQELSVLMTELKVIQDELDVYNSTKSGNHSDILSRRNVKQAEVDAKSSQIDSLYDQYDSIQNDIDSLRTDVQMSNFLTSEQMLELNNFVITKDYTNDSIVEEEDLLKDGIEAFKVFRQPKVSLNIDIVNFLQNLESQNDWDKLGLGDTVLISNKRLKVDISAKIIEIHFDLGDGGINLVLANEHELLDSDELFLKKIYDAANTSTSVNMNQWKWDLIEENNSLVHRLLNEGLNAAERAITAGYKQNISITERGIIIKSDQEPNKWIIMQNGVIGLTNNGGESWEVAITPDGVFAQTLIGKVIMGSRLIIEDENGIIRLSGSVQEIFDEAGNPKVILGEYEKGKFGLKINNGAIEIENGLPETQLDPDAVNRWNSAEQNAIDYVDSTVGDIRGDLRLTAPLPTSITMNGNGITASSSSSAFARLDYRGLYVQGGAIDIRTSSSTNRGVKFDGNGISAYNTYGTRTFHVDTNGNLTANNGTFGGRLDWAGGDFTGTLQAVNGTFTGELRAASGTFTGTVSAGSFSGGTITGATITGGTIKSNTSINVNTDAWIGNNLYLGNEHDMLDFKAIYFNYGYGAASISFNNDAINIGAMNGLIVKGNLNVEENSYIYFKNSTVDFTGSTVRGLTSTVVLG